MNTHHSIDIKPVPEKALFINEPWLVDSSFDYMEKWSASPETEEDNIRIYVPIDLNAEAILRRLHRIIYHYGEATEANESDFSSDVGRLVSQIEIYDQMWFARGEPSDVDESGRITGHSRKGIELVKQIVAMLEEIPDGCAECFPFELIDELKEEYLDNYEPIKDEW